VLLVVGLGNPGPTYARNRHNIGFRVVTAFREAVGLERFAREGDAEVSRGRRRGRPVVLVKPLSYMNRSGGVVEAVMRAERVTTEELLVVVDDIYLPAGRLRLRRQGGDGGHNGLRSILDVLGDGGFARLRIGVGAPPPNQDMKEWVLTDFAPEEEPVMEDATRGAVAILDAVLSDGVDLAMNRFNRTERVKEANEANEAEKAADDGHADPSNPPSSTNRAADKRGSMEVSS
jgi:PTH1 family peptidyl-tRNA hydrolase